MSFSFALLTDFRPKSLYLSESYSYLTSSDTLQLLVHPFDSGEKDLNDQVVHRGLQAARDLVTISLARASGRMFGREARGQPEV